jgi:energy-coupling factor transport system ATP-binding protein
MNLVLEDIVASRGDWSIAAKGMFSEGIHLISGDVGSGKSTLALIMAGHLPQFSGSVTRSNISSMIVSFQFPEYHISGTSIREECSSWGLDPETLTRSIGLTGKEDCDPFSLSRGELKRLHLACILAREYDLLILDEPFSSLDAGEKHRICSILSARSHGVTIVFTHEQAIFPRVGHIWEIVSGQLEYCGTPPGGLCNWHHAPPLILRLIAAGKVPENIAPEDLLEAACRT